MKTSAQTVVDLMMKNPVNQLFIMKAIRKQAADVMSGRELTQVERLFVNEVEWIRAAKDVTEALTALYEHHKKAAAGAHESASAKQARAFVPAWSGRKVF